MRTSARLLATAVLLTAGCTGGGEEDAAKSPPPRDQVQEQAIAFATRVETGAEQEIWLVDTDGSNKRQLTENPPRQSEDSFPAWSPDGRAIAFVSTRSRQPDVPVPEQEAAEEIYVLSRDGSGVQRLTTNTDLDVAPNWLPDGRVAFVSCRVSESERPACALAAIDPRTREREELGDLDFTYDVDVSPNGQRIAYASIGNPHFQTAELHVSDLDGDNHAQLTDNDTGDGSPAWSPDGRKVAFVSNRAESASCFWHDCAGYTTDVYVMDADGSDVTRLTETPHEESRPTWSPDGTRIVYSTHPESERAPGALRHERRRQLPDPARGRPLGRDAGVVRPGRRQERAARLLRPRKWRAAEVHHRVAAVLAATSKEGAHEETRSSPV